MSLSTNRYDLLCPVCGSDGIEINLPILVPAKNAPALLSADDVDWDALPLWGGICVCRNPLCPERDMAESECVSREMLEDRMTDLKVTREWLRNAQVWERDAGELRGRLESSSGIFPDKDTEELEEWVGQDAIVLLSSLLSLQRAREIKD